MNQSRRFSKLTALSLISFSLTLGAISCTQPDSTQPSASSSQPQARSESASGLQVVASYSVLCDMAEQIAQSTIDLTCLIEAGQDPHTYSPTPADRRAIENADLVLYNGYEFEPEIIQMIEAANTSAPKVAVSEVAVADPLLGEAHDHRGKGDAHSEGEHHAEDEMAPDPHIWHDAENGVAMVDTIQARLSDVSPENAELYETNAKALTAQIEQIDTWIQTQIDSIPDASRTLISTHEALGYYADAYGLELEPALDGFSTEIKPSAADVKALTEVVKSKSVPSIFVESTSNPGLIETVSRETDIAVSQDPIYADGLGEPETSAATYQEMLVTNTCTIVDGLGGTCDLP